ncbi:MAG TPA: ScyD/ScyE family protein [Thermoanaerobaculia bacterium]|nr:ScyD/ScyE family protein [Thermoanaerobaculia bacterium]
MLSPAAGVAQSILTAGTERPFKIARTPGGNFLLAESGTGEDDGRVALLSLWGDQFRLLSWLPSAINFEGAPAGPTAVAQAQATVYVVMGAGDQVSAMQPPRAIPNPEGPSSPIFSSVLRARFDPVPDSIREGFELTSAHVRSLADGLEVALENESGEHVELLLLADFRDLEPDPVTTVREANPFAAAVAGSLTQAGLVELGFADLSLGDANFLASLFPESPLGQRLEERTTVYVVDASTNTINQLDAATGRWSVLVRFPPVANPLFPNLGGPVTDAVPTGIWVREDGDLLVSFLTGFPFATGVASVRLVDAETGAVTPFISGLTTVTDVLQIGDVTYVLEFSTNFLARAPGRILRFETPSATPTVVAGGLIGAAGLAYEPSRHELLVSEAFTGRIVRVPLGG